jgi:hypothetical protein
MSDPSFYACACACENLGSERGSMKIIDLFKEFRVRYYWIPHHTKYWPVYATNLARPPHASGML